MKTYFVYILSNKYRGSLYIGITSNLQRRIIEHKRGLIEGFTDKYNLKKLVYVESYQYVDKALRREKQLKWWMREWKVDLIEQKNPTWQDLYIDYFGTTIPEIPALGPG